MIITSLPSGELSFFIEAVKSFDHVAVSDETTIYLANLLCRMTKSDSFFEVGRGGKLTDKAFCVQLYEAAAEADRMQKRLQLQRTADSILFYSGFFRPRIERQGLSLSYFFSMGKQAYFQVSNLDQKRRQVFLELAGQYADISQGISQLQVKLD
jgi:hypothetical protein